SSRRWPRSRRANGASARPASRSASSRARRPAGLRQRVLTGLVLAVVLLGVMLGLPPIATIWLLTVLILIGAWEWAAFLGNGSAPARAGFTVAVAALLIACLYFYSTTPSFVRFPLTAAMMWWSVALLWVCLAPARVHPVGA